VAFDEWACCIEGSHPRCIYALPAEALCQCHKRVRKVLYRSSTLTRMAERRSFIEAVTPAGHSDEGARRVNAT
jgi:hypothetical protein